MNQKKLDYSALSTKYSFAHIAKKYFAKVGGPILFGVVLLVIYFSVVGANIVSQDPNDAVKSFVIRFAIFSFVFIMFVTIFIIYWLIDYAGGYKEQGRLKEFAKVNNLVYSSNLSSENYQGVIFSNYASDRVESSIMIPAATGTADFDIEVANYRYSKQYTDSKKTYYKGFVRVDLKKNLPNIVLNSKANDSLLSDTLPGSFKSKQKLSLEGDFDKYFDLYTPSKYKRDALYFLTPDVMHSLIKNCSGVDVEIIDNHLYFYHADRIDLTMQETYTKNIEMAESIYKELKNPTNRYKDSQAVATENAQPQIAKHGRRLEKRRFMPLVTIIVLLTVGLSWILAEKIFHGDIVLVIVVVSLTGGILRLILNKFSG